MASNTKNIVKLRQKKVKTFDLAQSIYTVRLFQVSLLRGHRKQLEWVVKKKTSRLSHFWDKGPSEEHIFRRYELK